MKRLCVCLLFCPLILPGAVSPALEAYLTGLDALRQGQYADAAANLGRAIGAQQDPAFFLARGVALCLGGKPQDALADLERAKQGRELGREPELWIYITETIYGFATPDHRFGGPRAPATSAVSMPGNMMQAGKDYPTDYASFVFQEMARPVQSARERGNAGPNPADFARLKLQAGAWFANRAATRQDLGEAHLALAFTQHNSGKYADVIQTAKFIAPVYPDDPQIQYLVGDSWSALGRPATARKQLTVALTNAPAYPEAYAARAFNAARTGDERRARADLDVLQKLKPDLAAKYRPQVEKDIAANKGSGDWHQIYFQLEKDARGGAQMDALIQRATEFLRAEANGRRHYDEWYQDQWRQLDAAAGAAPKDPAPLAKAARFLLDESSLSKRGEEVEPRHGSVPFRTQTSATREIQKAIALCDAGLKLNPNHVASLMTKAMALERLGQNQQAEQIVNYALQVAPRDPQALSMRAEFLIDHANAMYSRATALRTPTTTSSSHQETRSDGIYDVTVTTYHPPTAEALAEASELEAQANEYMRRSEAAIQAALAVTKGTFEGLMLQAQWDMGSQRFDAARNELLQAIKQSPYSLDANFALADLYSRTSQADLKEQQLNATMNLVETSCGWLLHQAWRAINAGNIPAISKALDAARQSDPSDGRVAAYTAVFAQMTGNQPEAQAQFRVALAVEEAKLRMDSTSAAGVNLPRDMQQVALNLRLRDILGQSLIAANPGAAVALLEPGAVWAQRTPRSGRTAQMFGAMLPQWNAPAIPVPAPENAATVMGEVTLDYGKALKAAGRAGDALPQFQLVASFGWTPGIVGIVNGNGQTNLEDLAPARVADDARLQVAKIRKDQGDCKGAVAVLQFGVAGPNLNPATNATAEVAQERQQLFEACTGQRMQQLRPGPPQGGYQIPRPGPPAR